MLPSEKLNILLVDDQEAKLLTYESILGDLPANLRPGHGLILITWLDRARRDVLSVHPRGDVSRPAEGIFCTRSPHRPNPLGLHEVTVTAIEGGRVRVRSLEAIDGTPIVDVKPVLSPDIARR